MYNTVFSDVQCLSLTVLRLQMYTMSVTYCAAYSDVYNVCHLLCCVFRCIQCLSLTVLRLQMYTVCHLYCAASSDVHSVTYTVLRIQMYTMSVTYCAASSDVQYRCRARSNVENGAAVA